MEDLTLVVNVMILQIYRNTSCFMYYISDFILFDYIFLFRNPLRTIIDLIKYKIPFFLHRLCNYNCLHLYRSYVSFAYCCDTNLYRQYTLPNCISLGNNDKTNYLQPQICSRICFRR